MKSYYLIFHITYPSYSSTKTTSNIYWEYTDWNWLNIKRYFHYGPIVKMNKVTDIKLGHFWGDWMNVKISSEFCHLYKCEFEKNLTQLWLRIVTYTRDRNVLSMWFLAGNQGNHQNSDQSLLTNKLWRFFKKKNFKMADSKKVRFSKSPILKKFFWKFHGSVLGLEGLVDAKGIDLSQPIWLWDCLT